MKLLNAFRDRTSPPISRIIPEPVTNAPGTFELKAFDRDGNPVGRPVKVVATPVTAAYFYNKG